MATISWINADEGIGIDRIEIYRSEQMQDIQSLQAPYAILSNTTTEYTDPTLTPGSVYCYQVKFVNTDNTVTAGQPRYAGWYTDTGARGTDIINGNTELGLVWCGADNSIKLRAATLTAILGSQSASSMFPAINSSVAKQIFRLDPYFNTVQKIYKYMYKGRYYFACGAIVKQSDVISATVMASLLTVMKTEILDKRMEIRVGASRYWVRFPTLQEYEEIFKASFDIYNARLARPVTSSPLAGLCYQSIDNNATTTFVDYTIAGYASDAMVQYSANLQLSGHVVREWTTNSTDFKHVPLVWEPIV